MLFIPIMALSTVSIFVAFCVFLTGTTVSKLATLPMTAFAVACHVQLISEELIHFEEVGNHPGLRVLI